MIKAYSDAKGQIEVTSLAENDIFELTDSAKKKKIMKLIINKFSLMIRDCHASLTV